MMQHVFIQVCLFNNVSKKVIIKYLHKKSIAVAVDGKGCVGPTGSTNGPTQEAVSLKDIDDAAGVEGCR